MKIRIRFTGRRQNAIGIFYNIGEFEGEGKSPEEAIESARMAAYNAGFDHVQINSWSSVDMNGNLVLRYIIISE